MKKLFAEVLEFLYGLLISFLSQLIVLPLFGFHNSTMLNIELAFAFSLAGICLSAPRRIISARSNRAERKQG
jgi:hypothetical protein